MDFDEFLIELNHNRNCNFIAYAMTYLHADSVDATIKYIQSLGIDVVGYVLIMEHHITGKILSKEDFLCAANNHIEFIYLNSKSITVKSFFDTIKAYSMTLCGAANNKKNRKDIYLAFPDLDIFWAREVGGIFSDKNMKYVILEDGAASYMNDIVRRLCFFEEEEAAQYNILLRTVKRTKIVVRTWMTTVLEKLLYKRKRLVYGTIFCTNIKKGTVISKNLQWAPFFLDVYKEKGLSLQSKILDDFVCDVLINTQCLEENKATDGQVDFELYKKCIRILDQHHLSIVLKPHPRELNVQKYVQLQCRVCDGIKASQEIILASLPQKPKCIVSIYSSTLLNVQGLFEVPAVSLAKIVLKENISDSLRETLLDFIAKHEELFLFPESIEEFEDMILKLV